MVDEETLKTLEKANMQLAAGEFQKSYNTYKKLSKEHTELSEAFFGMAEASVGIPKISVQDVASYYQKACDLDPANPIYLTIYGNFCFENGILKKGEDCFLKASEVDEENSSLYLSDLATNYYHSAIRFSNHYPNMSKDEIIQTSLKYLLMAYNLDKEKAKSLIDRI